MVKRVLAVLSVLVAVAAAASGRGTVDGGNLGARPSIGDFTKSALQKLAERSGTTTVVIAANRQSAALINSGE